MTSKPIRYGIVGLGRAGWNIHAGELCKRPDARIVAVVDPVPERRSQAEREFACTSYSSLDSMLNQQDVDLVVIATPSNMHGSDTILALRAGKHVVVEKPMAVNCGQADEMIAATEQCRRKLFVHHNYRFSSEFTHLRDVVDSGILGRLFHLRMYLTSFTRRNDWQTLSKNGGGVLNNTGPHYIDQILQLIGGKVTQVMGDLQQIASTGDVEDHVKALIRFDNGCTADLEISNAQNLATPLPKWILCGTCGTLTCDGAHSIIRWFDPRQAAPLSAVDGPVMSRAYGNDDKLPWQEKKVPSIGPDAGSFYDNVTAVLRHGAPMCVTPESVREVMRVMAMIRHASQPL